MPSQDILSRLDSSTSSYTDVSLVNQEYYPGLVCPIDSSTDMIEAKGSSRHPLGQLAYRIISGNVWYDVRTVLEDQKVREIHMSTAVVVANEGDR
jgi:hypothetical protein